MRSISRISHHSLFTSFGIGLVLLVNACVSAQTVGSNSAHSAAKVLTNCEQIKKRYSVTLDYSAPKPSDFTNPSLPPPSNLMPTVGFNLHYADKTHIQVPSLDELGCLLNEQLAKLISKHRNDMPIHFRFFPGAIGSALMEPLDRRLVKPGANWDVKRGLPRHGRFGSVLNNELKQIIQESPIAKAFEANGYRLTFKGIIGGTDIQPVKALGGAKVPVSVYEMDMIATKITK